MSKTKKSSNTTGADKTPMACTVCGDLVYRSTDGKPFNASDDKRHVCRATTNASTPAATNATAAAATSNSPSVATCSYCGLRSRSALIVKRLDGERGRCVNTGACEKRQHRAAKVGP